MPVFNAYHYQPLDGNDEIRLLCLNPAKNKTVPLSCSIIPYRRASQTRQYSAVSYVWGKAEPTHRLEITHNDDTSYLKITATVDIMLRHLRARRQVRFLWIDAISLNQDDEDEKARQIIAMGCIYEEATDVRIWLGVGNVMTPMLCEFFREVSRGPERKQQTMASRIVALMKRFFDDGIQRTSAQDPFNPGCGVGVEYFYQFFQNPWFSRRWTIQEAVLSRKAIIKIGSCDILLSTVTLAASRFQSFDTSDYPMKVAATIGERAKKSSLIENLWTFHEARCSRKKDRVASLVGLGSGNGFEIDYKMSWENIYKQVASSALCSRNNEIRIQILLHLFEFGAVTNTGDLNYPSWVPDWSKTRRRDLPYHSHIRNVDTHEKYPAFLTFSNKASLILMNNNILHIQPNLSNGTNRAWTAVYTMPSGNSHFESGQVINLLERFFPLSSAESPCMILKFSSFVQYVGEFCHLRDADQSAAFEIYTTQFLRNLPGSITSEYFEALRWLGALLRKFCFCDLRPYSLPTDSRRGFSVGPNIILPGDIMIPLWRRIEHGDKHRSIVNRGARITFEITTMLVVRYDKGIHRWSGCGRLQDDVESPRGRIIGPALGIEFEKAMVSEDTPIPKFEQSDVGEEFFVA